MSGSPYRGRFAPSPSGPLHPGSLIAALASYLQARRRQGQWLVRMEDLDPPREQPGAADAILNSLLDHGLEWDGDVLYQSARSAAYDRALADLSERGLLFRCDCTRALLGPGGSCRGHCALRQHSVSAPWALRLTVRPDTEIDFVDQVQGRKREHLHRELADFTLRRKDALYAYQLAVVVDDACQGITHIVRGSDLLDSTGRQIYLQRLLGLPQPEYCHIPVLTNAAGEKLSKQNKAPALRGAQAADNLRRALDFLRQPAPPAGLRRCRDILDHARRHWSEARVPAVLAVADPAP